MEGPSPVAHGRAFDVLFDWLCARGPGGTAKHYLYKLNPGGASCQSGTEARHSRLRKHSNIRLIALCSETLDWLHEKWIPLEFKRQSSGVKINIQTFRISNEAPFLIFFFFSCINSRAVLVK